MTSATYLRATGEAYDELADVYAGRFGDVAKMPPLERALLTAYGEIVCGRPPGLIADLGCGPGHVTAHLSSMGIPTFGVDLSQALLTTARTREPQLRFYRGSMAATGLRDGAVAGIVAWYSLIHTPPRDVPPMVAELGRILAPGGHILLAFQAADEGATTSQPFEHKVAPAYRWPLDAIAAMLRREGMTEIARLQREPGDGERFKRAYVLAQR